ncbi:MAG: galactose-1-phosphate uridylyltransferase [Clostridiaceae bacterium]|nr:galactose-1-phosphate uridylyltransferase [Clostridiaceae bacterium]
MSNLRYDILTGNTVIISENRAKRPFDINLDKNHLATCPFCPGNEENTPPHLFSKGTPWTIRVVPNKYPALNNELSENQAGIFSSENITGSHYVIIDSDKHYNYLHCMEPEEIVSLICTYSWVMKELYKEETIKYVQIFKNYKKEGGSSLEHSHSQAVSLSFIPKQIQTQLDNAEGYYKENNTCLFCKMLQMEKEANTRIIMESDDYIAFAPYASLLPYEFSIYPKSHSSNFSNMTNAQHISLSILIKKLLFKLYEVLNNPAYNLYINSINTEKGSFHWNIRIVPRISIQAGFELSTGVILNSISPEKTKAILS